MPLRRRAAPPGAPVDPAVGLDRRGLLTVGLLAVAAGCRSPTRTPGSAQRRPGHRSAPSRLRPGTPRRARPNCRRAQHILDGGCELGNHTYTHPVLPRLGILDGLGYVGLTPVTVSTLLGVSA